MEDGSKRIVGKQGHNLNGRPKGVKNKATLFKEAMREGFEERLKHDGMKVFNAVVQKAIGPVSVDENGDVILDENGKRMYLDGDSNAQRMIMDRIVPIADVSKGGGDGKFTINISVGGIDSNIVEADGVIDGDFEEVE